MSNLHLVYKLCIEIQTLFLLATLCFASISMADDKDELKILEERIAQIEQKEYHKPNMHDIDALAKIKLSKKLNNLPDSFRQKIGHSDSIDDFLAIKPTKNAVIIREEVNQLIEKQFSSVSYKDIEKEIPMLEKGVRVSLNTRKGTITGIIESIYPSFIKINGRTINFIDLEPDDRARLNPDDYKKLLRKIMVRQNRKNQNEKEKLILELFEKKMFENGYLPLDEKYNLNCSNKKTMQWVTRDFYFETIRNATIKEYFDSEKNNYCLNTYNIKYDELKQHYYELKTKIQTEERIRQQEILAEQRRQQKEEERKRAREKFANCKCEGTRMAVIRTRSDSYKITGCPYCNPKEKYIKIKKDDAALIMSNRGVDWKRKNTYSEVEYVDAVYGIRHMGGPSDSNMGGPSDSNSGVRRHTCPTCGGRGGFSIWRKSSSDVGRKERYTEPCYNCHGSGYVIE